MTKNIYREAELNTYAMELSAFYPDKEWDELYEMAKEDFTKCEKEENK